MNLVALLVACAEPPVVGATGLGRFGSDPVQWPLPAPASTSTPWFLWLRGKVTDTCADGASGQLWYGFEPGFGPGRSIVVHHAECVGADVGRSHWEVTPWVPGAPATTIHWNLPAASEPGWPDAAGRADESCLDLNNGVRTWETVDLDGDGAQDLVVTTDECADAAIGSTRWEVHLGGPEGFAEASTAWALPPVLVDLAHPWAALAGEDTWGCPDGGYGTFTHALRDLTGDGAPDLVVTRDDCADPGVGVTHWNVHAGGVGGFAVTPIRWALPARDGGRPWWTLDGYAGLSCTEEVEPSHREVRDVDGDGLVDLLLTWDVCAPDWDPSTWRLFRGDGGGFAPDAQVLDLPAASAGSWTRSTASQSELPCTDGRLGARGWALDDIDGDGPADLVLTYDSCADDPPGIDAWRVYPGGPAGFGPPVDWGLPSGAVDLQPKWEVYEASAGLAGCLVGGLGSVAYAAVDVDGDRVRDLVVTRDECSDPTAGFDHWRVFFGETGAGGP